MSTSVQKIRVALVEDHQVVRKAICRMLSDMPNLEIVFDVSNGQAFLDRLKDQEVDVVLLDIEMPVMNGYKTLLELKKQQSPIKVVMLSMHDDYDIAYELLQEGIHAYLLKECSLEEMVEAIVQVHEGTKYTNAFMNAAINHHNAENQKRKTRSEHYQLDERDLMILKMICDGRTSQYISDNVPTSKKNVDLIRTKLMKKLMVQSANELIRVAILNGFYAPRTNAEIEQENIDAHHAALERRLSKLKQNALRNEDDE
jgi:DNA-binding NarL/FixJ family response regulator